MHHSNFVYCKSCRAKGTNVSCYLLPYMCICISLSLSEVNQCFVSMWTTSESSLHDGEEQEKQG